MRTVKWLRDELANFPDDALCYAYSGEVIGIIVKPTETEDGGEILCSEYDDSQYDEDTSPQIPEATRR